MVTDPKLVLFMCSLADGDTESPFCPARNPLNPENEPKIAMTPLVK
jgi:hypothetical protein